MSCPDETHTIEVLPGTALVSTPRDLIDQGMAQLLNAAGVPRELYEGAASYGAGPASMRIVESRLIRTQEDMLRALQLTGNVWTPRLDDDDTFRPLWLLGEGVPESHRMPCLFSMLYIRGRKPLGVRGRPVIFGGYELVSVDDPD